jgi:hypothetical protein
MILWIFWFIIFFILISLIRAWWKGMFKDL